MEFESIIFEIVIIFSGVAILSSLFLFLKQPIIISYITLGVIVGPFGFGLIKQANHIENLSHLGIILLLFLIGLNLHPQKLISLFKKTAIVTCATSAMFAIIFGLISFAFGFLLLDSIVIGIALMFSSTIVGLKLIPTTTLHQKHLGEMMVSVLLLQDILAIVVIIFLEGGSKSNLHIYFPILIVKGICIVTFSFLFFKYCILWLFKRYDTIQEYILVVALGWCFAIAGISKTLGITYEIGAFIAGCSFAISPISLIISEKLKSLREFFLILFFFAIGTQFDFLLLKHVIIPGVVLAITLIFVKPVAFSKAFLISKEKRSIAIELSFRLGQASEFSLLVAYMAIASSVISEKASYLIQLTTILTWIISTYIVSFKYATPIATIDKLRRD